MKYKTKDCFERKTVAGDSIVLARGAASIDFSAVVVLNEAGTFIWDLLADFAAPDALARALAEKYSIDEATAAADVEAYLSKMLDEGLLDCQ